MRFLTVLALVWPLIVPATPAGAMVNPASAFCEKLGGKVEIVRTSTGEIGLCHLKDGRIIEEWTLFRMHDGKVPANGSRK